MKQLLFDLLKTRSTPEGQDWLAKALQAAAPPVHANTLLGYFAGASRRMGKQALHLTGEEATRAQALDPELSLNHWGADEAARALLLLELHGQAPGQFQELALLAYEKGDSREQESWCRALAILPEAERFLDVAIDACRTNIIPLFEAIACENPYPCRFFPELNFNQLVMKTFFNGLEVSRIKGLEKRLNGDLSRISNDFISEREAAGRDVPTDIWLAMLPHAEEKWMARARGYLEHQSADHRYWVAVGMGHLGTAAGGELTANREALTARGAQETEPRVKQAIKDALAQMG